MFKYKLVVEYCGTNYHGMQKQDGLKTIEGQLLLAINKMFPKETEILINYAGRTDTGVHAAGQVVDLSLKNKINPYKIVCGLNSYLIDDEISIISAEEVDFTFDSRFSAKQRIYVYKVITRKSKLTFQKNKHLHCPYKLDFQKMKEQSKFLIGRHDFRSFCSSENEANPVRTVDFLEIKELEDGFEVYIGAKSFLHNMVRIIVGTLIDIGRDKIHSSIKGILELKNRKFAGKTVSPDGLYLLKIIY